jgi:hypothetical protein
VAERVPTAGQVPYTVAALARFLGEGKISAKEMPVPPDTRQDHIRHAPGFGGASTEKRLVPYTVESLAKFLGETKDNGTQARESFRAAFDALELISEGYLTEAQIKRLHSVQRRARNSVQSPSAHFSIC